MATLEQQLHRLYSLRDSINASIGLLASVNHDDPAQKAKIEKNRQQISATATLLADETANPMQAATKLSFMPWENAVVKTALDLDLFNLLDVHTSAAALAEASKADPTLVARLMRVLTGFNIVRETGEHIYAHGPVSKALTAPPLADLNKHAFDSSYVCISKLPAYLASINYANPEDADNTLSHYATGTDFFAFLRADPIRQARFNSAMRAQGNVSANPVPRAALEANSSDVIMVDVGGGVGQVTDKVMEENPDLAAHGKFIVQDLGAIVDAAKARNPNFEAMEYDFFAPQPVRGARAYHLRRVLHDFPDSKCREIMKNQRSAMSKDSRLLISEAVLTETGVTGFEALADISRITFCSLQRSEKQWKALLGSAGFKVVKIWRGQVGAFAVIEAVMDDAE